MKKLTEIMSETYYSSVNYIPETYAIKKWIEQFRELKTATNTYANIGYQSALTDLLNTI